MAESIVEHTHEKEPWEMTREEFIKRRKERLKKGIEYRGYFTPEQLHRRAVEGALQNKEPIPPEVLKDYPKLTEGVRLIKKDKTNVAKAL